MSGGNLPAIQEFQELLESGDLETARDRLEKLTKAFDDEVKRMERELLLDGRLSN